MAAINGRQRRTGDPPKLILLFGAAVVLALVTLATLYRPDNLSVALGILPSRKWNRLRPLIAPENRGQIPEILQINNFTRGAELGVQAGAYAEHVLNIWTSCRKYYLVDIWAAQENYKDIANVGNDAQENFYQETKKRLERFSDKTEFMRMKTVEAARLVPDASLDFIYVDARHDYCGVKEDIEHWWPKLRPGGIMAGHDYVNAGAQVLKDTNQDWSVCNDGSVHPGAVKGAVDEFAVNNGLTVAVTYREPDWPSWLVVKPVA